MTQRIQKLAEQALNEYNATYHNEAKIPEAYLKKFAELIVRECIDILPEKVKIDDLYDGRILVQCGMAIKEHFGVE